MAEGAGAKLRRAREAAGISLSAMARLTNYSRFHLSNVESGRQRVPVDVVWRLAVLFNVPIHVLLPEPIRDSRSTGDLPGLAADPDEAVPPGHHGLAHLGRAQRPPADRIAQAGPGTGRITGTAFSRVRSSALVCNEMTSIPPPAEEASNCLVSPPLWS